MCQDFHVLPISGGMLDQDSLFIYLYQVWAEAKSVRAELDNRKAELKNQQLRQPGRGR